MDDKELNELYGVLEDDSIDEEDTIQDAYISVDELFEDIEDDEDTDFLDRLVPSKELASLINKGCKDSNANVAFKYLVWVAEQMIGKDGLGKDIVIRIKGTEEVDIRDWNDKADTFTEQEEEDKVTWQSVIKESPLLTREEQESLLGLNDVAVRELIKKFQGCKSTQTTEPDTDVIDAPE